MVNKLLVLGDAGTGKTTAAESLDPKSTFIICSDNKGLPFKGWKKNYKTVTKENGKLDLLKTNYYETSDPGTIITLVKAIADKRPDIKVIMIDTLTAIMEDEYMSKAKEAGFTKFTDMALDTFNILTVADAIDRNDLSIIITAHTEDAYDAAGALKTSFKVIGGKLIGEKIKVEGRFNNVLYTEVVMKNDVPEYYFLTQNNGRNTCRTQKDLFEDLRIPNDYKLVLQKIKEYEEG
jgi:hypothetical protein